MDDRSLFGIYRTTILYLSNLQDWAVLEKDSWTKTIFLLEKNISICMLCMSSTVI